jgi:hypothetical protein
MATGATAMWAREAVTTSRPTALVVAEGPGSSFSVTNFGTFLLGGLGT